jgi:glycosyltransferase involved in cell wall biosynthesis
MSKSEVKQHLNIGIWLNMPEPKVGGGFSYALDILLAIDNFQFDPTLNFVFLSFPPYNEPYTKYIKNKEVFRVSQLQAQPLRKNSLPARIVNRFKREFIKPIASTSSQAPASNEPKWRSLQERGIHLIFYPVQHQVLFDDFPFVSNNWDLGHLSTHAFPELASSYEYEHRDKWYRNVFSKAFAIFVESEQGKKELTDFLTINPEKIKILPHFYTGSSSNFEVKNQDSFLKKHSLKKDNFFFYPAQFWAHKNHYNLLLGFKQFLNSKPDSDRNFKLVFTGSNQGNLEYVQQIISEYDLANQVAYLGFVSKEEIESLYRNAIALVYASFLGPSNLPLIEAMYYDCPVLCSSLPGNQELCEEAAFYFNPEAPADIAKAMSEVLRSDVSEELKSKAAERIKSGIYSASNAMQILEKNFLEVKNTRLTWK